jgi:hypothetical protein
MTNPYYRQIEGESSFVKDIRSSALINTDLNALHEHKQKRRNQQLLYSMQDEINMLKEELEKIKNHLKIE